MAKAVTRIAYFFWFLVVFLIAFIQANIAVAYIVLFVPNSKLSPSLFDYDVSDMTSSEILLFTQCLTLTPGTVTVDISSDRKWIRVHCLDYREPQKVKAAISKQLKTPILRFMR